VELYITYYKYYCMKKLARLDECDLQIAVWQTRKFVAARTRYDFSNALRIKISEMLPLTFPENSSNENAANSARSGGGENEITYETTTTVRAYRILFEMTKVLALEVARLRSSAAAASLASRKFLWQARRKYRPTLRESAMKTFRQCFSI